MFRVNENYQKLPGAYLFSEIAKRVREYSAKHPEAEVIRLGIGDVTRPLPPAVITAMQKAVQEMGEATTFRGYGPEQGHDFLRQAIAKNSYQDKGISIEIDEIFVSDGSKSDTANFQELLSQDAVIAVCDPVYPVYVDTQVMAGRAGTLGADGSWSNIEYLPCNAENGFVPPLPSRKVDVIYLCLPNNPTGTTLTRTQLKKWVDYARENGCLILFDAAYEAYISESDVPHSIYEIEGAREVAIEFRSFSKTAGFTGTRCAFTVVPKNLHGSMSSGEKVQLHPMWNRRHATKFNGVPYIVQRGAEAVYSEEGQSQVKENIAYYMENARIIREGLAKAGFEIYGGINAPYIWLKTPQGMDSWAFFDKLLNEVQVVGTPGVGFGACGQGYFRLTAFGDREDTVKAMARIIKWRTKG